MSFLAWSSRALMLIGLFVVLLILAKLIKEVIKGW